MARWEIKNVNIAGVAMAVPEHTVKTAEIDLFTPEEAEVFDKTVGIKSRHIAPDTMCASDMCQAAGEKLLEELGWEKESINALIFESVTGDYRTPPTSCLLQYRMGLSEDCFCVDIPMGCCGCMYAITVAGNLLTTGQIKRALVLVGDTALRMGSMKDKSRVPLFGDGGTALALEYDENAAPIRFHIGTDGSGYDALIIPDGGARNQLSENSFKLENIDGKMMHRVQGRMKGMDVFSFGITTVPKSFKKFCEHFNTTLDSFDYYVLHQANKKMDDAIVKKLKLNPECVPYSLHNFGNTSSASIPLTIVTKLKNACEDGCKDILCCGFGIGLSWGTVSFKISQQCKISDLVEVDEEGDDKIHIV